MNDEERKRWFEHQREVLETSYTAHPDSEPWRQSGMSGPEERWISLRKPLANCIDRPGSFLDIGCANGYLLECMIKWTAERGITIDPFGLDISPRLVEMARKRLPQYADHIFLGNSYEWRPPRRFDFARTELVYVPAEVEQDYVERIFAYFLKPDGRLIIANYMEGAEHPEEGALPGSFATSDILSHLADLNIRPTGYLDAYDPIKNRKRRFVIVTREGLE